MKEYSRTFDEEDAAEESSASKELVAHRKRLVDEWNAWRAKVRADRGKTKGGETEKTEEIQEWVEELIEETTEVVG